MNLFNTCQSYNTPAIVRDITNEVPNKEVSLYIKKRGAEIVEGPIQN